MMSYVIDTNFENEMNKMKFYIRFIRFLVFQNQFYLRMFLATASIQC